MTRGALPALAVVAAGVGSVACTQAPLHAPDTIVYQGTKEPMQYRSAQPRDAHGTPVAPPQAVGVACSTTVAFPPQPPALFYGSEAVVNALPWPSFTIGAGDLGYSAAMRRAHDAAGPGTTLFDVRADLHTTAILGIVRRDCTEVHASVARAGAPAQ